LDNGNNTGDSDGLKNIEAGIKRKAKNSFVLEDTSSPIRLEGKEGFGLGDEKLEYIIQP
jgi:hypothetical protein